MNGTPLVSVVMGVYNKADYVGSSLRSVLAQTYGHFELIVVDDCSTDGSLAEIRKFEDPRIRLVRLPENSRRPAVPRNRGMAVAGGKYIAFLDADDRWEPTKLEKQVAFMEAHPEYELTHTYCWKIDGEGRRLGIRHEGTLPPSGDYWLPMLERVWISTSTLMLTRGLYEKTGGFTEAMPWRIEEDPEFALRCAMLTPFGLLAEPLSEYRTGIDNITASKAWKGIGRDFVLYRHIWETPALWEARLTRREMRDRVVDMAEEGAFYWRARKEYGHALWFAGQMLRLAPFQGRGWKQLVAAGFRRG